MSSKETIASNGALEQIHKLKLSASRHFHAEVSEQLSHIAPSALSFTCIGVENVRAYSYLRSANDREGTVLLPPRWACRLSDLLPAQLLRTTQEPRVLHPSQMGPMFEAADPDGRVLLVVLESCGVVQGIAGLSRTSHEPAFSAAELAEISARVASLSLAATYVLTVELLAYEEAAGRASSGRSALLMLADREARRVIWASSAGAALDWERDVLPAQRLLFEEQADPVEVPEEAYDLYDIHELELGGMPYSVIRVPAIGEQPLSRREREVAQLLIDGYANLNIAAHLGISENTIRTYIRRLYKKLKVCNRIDLIRAYEAVGG